MSEHERGFSYLRTNDRQGKPRTRGITEIRAAYYTPSASATVSYSVPKGRGLYPNSTATRHTS